MLAYILLSVTLLPFAYGQCPPINPPKYGSVSCTKSEMPGSVCNITCDKYFDLAGTTEPVIETTCDDYGSWTVSPEVTCNPILCEYEHKVPVNGDLICTADRQMASLCVFYCDEHFNMKGVKDRTAYSICEDDGDGDDVGHWIYKDDVTHPPVCEAMRCDPPYSKLENGVTHCTAGNYAGSLCVFYCNGGYELVGQTKRVVESQCKDWYGDGVAQWTLAKPPKCQKIVRGVCNEPPYMEGAKYDCNSYTYVRGTVCTMNCVEEEDQLVGNPNIKCNSARQWQSHGIMPYCKRCYMVKKLGMLALIRSTNDKSKFALGVKFVTRLATLLKKRYRFDLLLSVRTYDNEVNGEFYKSAFGTKRDKATLEDFTFTDDSIENALGHGNTELPRRRGGSSLQIMFLITDEMKPSANAMLVADLLRARGVVIFCIGLSSSYGPPGYDLGDFAKLTGSPEQVYEIGDIKQAEKVKVDVAAQIRTLAMEKGCAPARRIPPY